MPTFKWTFAADDKGVAKMMRDTAVAVKEAETATAQASSKMSTDLDKVTAAAEKTSKSGKTLGDAFTGGFGKSLQSDLSSVLPAGVSNITSQLGGIGGLLGGISTGAAVATAGIAAAGAGAVKFGVDAVKSFESSALAVRHYQEIAGGSAETASVMVGAAKELGVSSDTLATSMGKLAKDLGSGKLKLDEWGISLAKNADGSTNMVGTLKNIVSALGAISDPVQRATEGAALFGKGWTNMSDLIAQGSDVLNQALDSASQHAPIFHQDDLAAAVKFREETVALGQEWDKLKVKAGEKLLPWIEDEISKLVTLGTTISNDRDKFDSFSKSLTEKKSGDPWYVTGLKNANNLLSEVIGSGPAGKKSLNEVGDAANNVGQDVHGLGEAARDGLAKVSGGALEGVGPMNELGGAIDVVAGKLTTAGQASAGLISAVQGLASSTSVQTSGTAGWANAIDAANTSLNQGAVDAAAYADAQTQGGRQIASAEKSVTDAVAGVADAQEALAKTSADAARSIADAEAAYAKAVVDANQKVADTEASTSKSIVDAEQKVADARHQAAEAAESSARRVQDAQQALLDAETNSLREANPYDAQRKREDAGQALTRAQEDAAQQQADSADTVARAQQSLADVQVQASQDRARAEQDAADQIAQAQQRVVDAHNQAADQIEAAQKRVADANDKVGEANGRLKQTTDDVALSLEKAATKADGHAVSLQGAQTQAQAVVDASPAFVLAMQARGLSIDDINTALDGGKTAIENLGTAFGIPKPVIDDMIGQLDQVLARVLSIRDLTKNAYDWWAALTRSAPAGVTAEQMVADAGWSSAKLQPTHDSGGWLPMGVSLAVNKTGRPERVLSPAEMDAAAGGGGGVTVNVLGAVISERDLADIIAKAVRRGNKFGLN